VEVEVGTETSPVHVVEVEDEDERQELYARQTERMSGFGDYPKKTSRRIPVIALERADAAR
jgi:hypothetical protein